MKALQDHKGFTLLEILVALAVLAVVVISAVRNNNEIIDNSIYLRDKTLAHFVAMNRAAELRLEDKWIPLGKTEGEYVLAGRRWFWTVLGKKTPVDDVRIAEISVYSTASSDDSGLANVTMYIGRPITQVPFQGGQSSNR